MRDDLSSPSKPSCSNCDSQRSYPFSSSEHLYINDHDTDRAYEEDESTNSFISLNTIQMHLEASSTTTTTSTFKKNTNNTISPTVINPRSWQRLSLAPRYGDMMPVFKEGISIPEAITTLSTPSQVLITGSGHPPRHDTPSSTPSQHTILTPPHPINILAGASYLPLPYNNLSLCHIDPLSPILTRSLSSSMHLHPLRPTSAPLNDY